MSEGKVDPDQFTKPFMITKTTHRQPFPAILPDNPRNDQTGKIIIITGAGEGIGKAAALVWARAKASGIVLAARRLNLIEETAAEIRKINKDTVALPIATDITKEEDVKNLYAQVQKTFGRPADVLLNNAGALKDGPLLGEQSVDDWWSVFEVDVKGPFAMIHHFIRSQPDPSKPVGTIITLASGRSGLLTANGSAYNVAKGAVQRLTEHVDLEYPTLRAFSIMPGVVPSAMANDFWMQFAHDHADLTGGWALYLVQPRADYLKGGIIQVNWDIDELEKYRDRIQSEKLLHNKWIPLLPLCGGKGLQSLDGQ